MESHVDEVIAAILFAGSAVIAAIAAFKDEIFRRVNALYIAVAAAAAGFFALVVDAASKAFE